MAMFLDIGLPGHGKSLYSAYWTWRLYKRNLRWFKKTGIERKIYSNQELSEFWQKKGTDQWVIHWDYYTELLDKTNIDIIWDEIAHQVPAGNQKLPFGLRNLFENQDRRGIDIYANTQMPMQVHIYYRRLCENMFFYWKLCGSRRPAKTKPKTWFIWGLIIKLRLKRNSFSANEDEFEYDINFFKLPEIITIDKWKTNLYSTWQEKPDTVKLPDLVHLTRFCQKCKKEHISHE